MSEWQQQEMRRREAVDKAVLAADRIILDASDGSVEETNYLTGEVALMFVQKVHNAFRSALDAREFEAKFQVSRRDRRA